VGGRRLGSGVAAVGQLLLREEEGENEAEEELRADGGGAERSADLSEEVVGAGRGAHVRVGQVVLHGQDRGLYQEAETGEVGLAAGSMLVHAAGVVPRYHPSGEVSPVVPGF
jgi:hypothetical protein